MNTDAWESLLDAAGTPGETDPLIQLLNNFFERKGLAAIKAEDRAETWYDDWLAYQREHQIYARLLVPAAYSTLGTRLDLPRLTRFLQAFARWSPAHGYSLQVTFLGFFSILMGTNEAMKRAAAAVLEAGGLMAFGVSEKSHGADLLANEFAVRLIEGEENAPKRYVANGKKYYIGNGQCAEITAVLARKEDARHAREGGTRRAPMLLFAMRPGGGLAAGWVRTVTKIHTLGIRAAFVGEIDVANYIFDEEDIVAEGRDAWNAVFGTVTLGKFFLGFGAIGMCHRASRDAHEYLQARMLYGKPAIEMPHLKATLRQARARLLGMKLFAYRALDYVQAAAETERRYVLFTAVQKAKVSTEGVKVMGLISECVGAKGFEGDTFIEMALRDVQLIPGLEGSAHINLRLAAQFMPMFLFGGQAEPAGSLAAGTGRTGENEYLRKTHTGGLNEIGFRALLEPFRPYARVAEVRQFVRQARAFRMLMKDPATAKACLLEGQHELAAGTCLAAIAYGQLIAEHAAILGVPAETIAEIFAELTGDLAAAGRALGRATEKDRRARRLLGRMCG